MTYDKEFVKTLLPHRDPILLVDEITEVIPGESIKTRFTVPTDMEIFKGHFPGNPIFPGVYSIEALSQASACLLMFDEKNKGKLPIFLGVNKASFSKPIRPGDTIETHAKYKSAREDKLLYVMDEEAYVNGEPVAVCEAVLIMK